MRAVSSININEVEGRIRSVEARMEEPSFWADPNLADIMSSLNQDKSLMSLSELRGEIDFLSEIRDDKDLRDEVEARSAEISALVEEVLCRVRNGTHPAIVMITSGAGGEDAMDFAQMTMAELSAYAQKRGLIVEVQDETLSPSGIRDATLRISGANAFRIMRGEAGKRRMVRNSSYGAGGRHTSFCNVTVFPEIERAELRIQESELRYETYRDTGPGGQHRNTTDSAVRITHIPTGISAKSAMRSQHENKRIAMSVLMSRLSDLAEREADKESSMLKEGASDAGFGGHNRTVVLDPYQLIRNEDTGVTTSNVAGYMAGGEMDVRARFTDHS